MRTIEHDCRHSPFYDSSLLSRLIFQNINSASVSSFFAVAGRVQRCPPEQGFSCTLNRNLSFPTCASTTHLQWEHDRTRCNSNFYDSHLILCTVRMFHISTCVHFLDAWTINFASVSSFFSAAGGVHRCPPEQEFGCTLDQNLSFPTCASATQFQWECDGARRNSTFHDSQLFHLPAE